MEQALLDVLMRRSFPELAAALRARIGAVTERWQSLVRDSLPSADVVILSRIWDDWDEPNDARVVGSDEPNRVLRERFRRIGVYGDPYELYELWVPR